MAGPFSGRGQVSGENVRGSEYLDINGALLIFTYIYLTAIFCLIENYCNINNFYC